MRKLKTKRNKEIKKMETESSVPSLHRKHFRYILHTAAYYKKKQEDEGDLCLILFCATSYNNLSVYYRDDRS